MLDDGRIVVADNYFNKPSSNINNGITQRHIQWRRPCYLVSERGDALPGSTRKAEQGNDEVWEAMAPEVLPQIVSVPSVALSLSVNPASPVFRGNVRNAGLLWPVNF
jgi:hypothetical protein